MLVKVYQCRICGYEFEGETVEKRDIPQILVRDYSQIRTHKCFDGSVGIAQFNGYEVVRDETDHSGIVVD